MNGISQLVLGILACAILMTACNPPEKPLIQNDSVATQAGNPQGQEIRIQKTDLGYAAEIPYTYTNRSGDSVYLVNCNGDVSPSIERLVGDQWQAVWQPATNACLSPPVVIANGASYSDTL